MQKYGYLNQSGPQALITVDALVAALKLVQKFGGLEQTGQFDNDTLKVRKIIIITYIIYSFVDNRKYFHDCGYAYLI